MIAISTIRVGISLKVQAMEPPVCRSEAGEGPQMRPRGLYQLLARPLEFMSEMPRKA